MSSQPAGCHNQSFQNAFPDRQLLEGRSCKNQTQSFCDPKRADAKANTKESNGNIVYQENQSSKKFFWVSTAVKDIRQAVILY